MSECRLDATAAPFRRPRGYGRACAFASGVRAGAPGKVKRRTSCHKEEEEEDAAAHEEEKEASAAAAVQMKHEEAEEENDSSPVAAARVVAEVCVCAFAYYTSNVIL